MGKVTTFLGFVSLLTVPGMALATSADVTDGGPGARALKAREFRIAADMLKARSPDAINDAARLINLGNAYVGLGRYDAARKAYVRARYSPEQMLVLADGSEASSRDIAAKALSRLGTNFAAR